MVIRYLLITLVTFAVPASALSAAAATLSGRVLDQDGNPITGATVFIHTARPKQGTAIYCPSCYADCRKRTKTSSDGQFSIDGLDDSLLFRVLVAAADYEPLLASHFNPAMDEPEVMLASLEKNIDPTNTVRGRVVDTAGNPVFGAQVTPFARQTSNSTRYGGLNEIDPLSVTNEYGEFLLITRDPPDSYALQVTSPSHAVKKFHQIAPGETPHELAVETGAIVRGRVMQNGRPIDGVVVGLAQTNRNSESFLGNFEIGTKEDGKFEFVNIPPNDDFYIYALMETMAGIGSLPLQRVTVGASESIIDLGEMNVGPAHTLSGQIILTDGHPLPGPIQVLLSREGAWDSQKIMVGDDGRFEFYGVPHDEPVTISARIPGYRLAYSRNRFQRIREWSIALFVDQSRDDVEIHFEPDVNEPQ